MSKQDILSFLCLILNMFGAYYSSYNINCWQISMKLDSSKYYNNSAPEQILQKMHRDGYDCQKEVSKIRPFESRAKELLLGAQPSPRKAAFPLLSAIGLIRVNWRNKNKQLMSINYGTGFAVNNKFIVTCMHNIFSERLQAVAEEVFFIPGLNGNINDESQIYKCSQKKNIKCIRPSQSLAYSPQKEQIVLFKLDDGQEVNSSVFIKLGSLEDQNSGKQLQIIGYPTKQFYKKTDLEQVEAKRVALRGQLHSIQSHVIHHTLSTFIGHSGSPIITQDKNGIYYAVGMHTHRGIRPEFNSGVYFNQEILQRFKSFEEQLNFTRRKQSNIFKSKITLSPYKFPPPEKYFSECCDLSIDNRDSLQKIQSFENQLIQEIRKERQYVAELKIQIQYPQEDFANMDFQQTQNSQFVLQYSKKNILSQRYQERFHDKSKNEESTDQSQNESQNSQQSNPSILILNVPNIQIQKASSIQPDSQQSQMLLSFISQKDATRIGSKNFELNIEQYESSQWQDSQICLTLNEYPPEIMPIS